MKPRAIATLSMALLFVAPAASHAVLSSYSQNFEALNMADPAALQNDGWLVYGNVFTPSHTYLYGYGPFPAPNYGSAFCAIDAGQGGVEQGAQQLSVYSDYNNGDHGNGNLIESNVFHEQTIDVTDVGRTWSFQFDAKLGNLAGGSTALAFIKTLDPNNGYAMTNFVTANMTAIPATWNTYWIALTIDAGLAGQILQFGFANTATHYEPSGVYYDNLVWVDHLPAGVAGSPGGSAELHAAAPNPFTRSTRIEYALTEAGSADLSVFDITGRRVATLFRGRADAGRHTATWNGRCTDGGLAPTGVYHCVLSTATERRSRSLVLAR